MSYVNAAGYSGETLDGFFDFVKKAGGFVAKKVAPTALQFVPVVGPVASAAYSQIPGIRATPRPIPRLTTRAPQPPPSVPWWERAGRAALERARVDPGLRERAVEYTARYAPPTLLAAAAARQARAAPPAVKAATVLLPLVAVALLARKLL